MQANELLESLIPLFLVTSHRQICCFSPDGGQGLRSSMSQAAVRIGAGQLWAEQWPTRTQYCEAVAFP